MIFCVEDDNNIRDLLVYTLETTGFHACGLVDSQELWKALAQEEPDSGYHASRGRRIFHIR